MNVTRVFKIVLGVIASVMIGWLALIGLNIAAILQRLEYFEAHGWNGEGDPLLGLAEELVQSVHGGPALAIASSVCCVLLSEVFRTRSLVYYMAATGGLTLGIAATLSEPGVHNAGYAAAALAIAGFVAGAIYWLIAGRSA